MILNVSYFKTVNESFRWQKGSFSTNNHTYIWLLGNGIFEYLFFRMKQRKKEGKENGRKEERK